MRRDLIVIRKLNHTLSMQVLAVPQVSDGVEIAFG